MQARMKNPVLMVPNAMQALLNVGEIAKNSGVAKKTLHLVYLRASQINGCSFCVDMHAREAKANGESDQRLFAVSAYREAPCFTDAERAALALTDAATRLSDRSEGVSDEVWNEASKHFDEPALASLLLNIAMINFWNRINVPTRQPAGTPIPRDSAAR